MRAEAERAAQLREDLSKEDEALIRFADKQFEAKDDIDAIHAIISHAGMQARKSLRGKCLLPKSLLGKIVAKCMVPTYNAQHTVDFEEARQIDDFLYDQYISHVEEIDTNLIFDELEELIESLQVYYMACNPNLPKYSTVISSMLMLRKL